MASYNTNIKAICIIEKELIETFQKKDYIKFEDLLKRFFSAEVLDIYSYLHLSIILGYEELTKQILFSQPNKTLSKTFSNGENEAHCIQYLILNNLLTINMAKLLFDNGVNIFAKDIYNSTSLHYAVYNSDYELSKFYIENGVDVNTINRNRNTPLHLAVYKDNKYLVKLLLSNQANLDIVDEYSSTALHIAISNRKSEIIKLLLKYNPNLSIQDQKGNTPLHLAIIGNLDHNILWKMIKYAYKSILNIPNNDGDTPLHLAIRQGDFIKVEWLLNSGANPNKENNVYDTPYFIAKDKEYYSISYLLEKYGAYIPNRNLIYIDIDYINNWLSKHEISITSSEVSSKEIFTEENNTLIIGDTDEISE